MNKSKYRKMLDLLTADHSFFKVFNKENRNSDPHVFDFDKSAEPYDFNEFAKLQTIKPLHKKPKYDYNDNEIVYLFDIPFEYTGSHYKTLDENGDELELCHCLFDFSEIKMIKNVIVGEHGTQIYQLNSEGVPVSHGFWEEDFEPVKELTIGESDYFEYYAQKTFLKEITNLNNSSHFRYGQTYCILKESGECSDILVYQAGATMMIIDKNHKPIIGKEKDVVYFHEIFFKDGQWIGSLGATEKELNSIGMPIL